MACPIRLRNFLMVFLMRHFLTPRYCWRDGAQESLRRSDGDDEDYPNYRQRGERNASEATMLLHTTGWMIHRGHLDHLAASFLKRCGEVSQNMVDVDGSDLQIFNGLKKKAVRRTMDAKAQGRGQKRERCDDWAMRNLALKRVSLSPGRRQSQSRANAQNETKSIHSRLYRTCVGIILL
jgi:hypothetical protein